MKKTINEDIEYCGLMLTATKSNDKLRLIAITKRLTELTLIN